MMPGRNFNASNYVFGYQGQLKTDEVYGSGMLYSYEFRESDPRLGGQFWSIDPLAPKYAGWSPYAFSQRRYIDGVELEGLEWQQRTDQDGNATQGESGGYDFVGFNEDGTAPEGSVPAAGYSFTDREGSNYLRVYGSNSETQSGTTDLYKPNENGMVQLPNNLEGIYNTYNQTGQDNWGTPEGIASLINASVEYQQQYPGERVSFGDLNSPNSAPIPLDNGGSHHGNTFQVDMRLLSTQGGSVQGSYNQMDFDPVRSQVFFNIMQTKGFSSVLLHPTPSSQIGNTQIQIIQDIGHYNHYHFQGYQANE